MDSNISLFLSYLVILVVAMYLLVYLPNKKKNRKKRELHENLKVGDKIVTIGGIVGKIVSKDESYVKILIDEKNKSTVDVIIYAVDQVIN